MTDQDIEKYVRLYHTMLYRVAFSYLRSSADARTCARNPSYDC